MHDEKSVNHACVHVVVKKAFFIPMFPSKKSCCPGQLLSKVFISDSTTMNNLEALSFENTYFALPDVFYERAKPPT